VKKLRHIWSRVIINSNGLEVNTFCENMLHRKRRVARAPSAHRGRPIAGQYATPGKVYTVVEVLHVENTNVLDSCVHFLNDYIKQPDLFDWIVKIDVAYSVNWDIFCETYYWVSAYQLFNNFHRHIVFGGWKCSLAYFQYWKWGNALSRKLEVGDGIPLYPPSHFDH